MTEYLVDLSQARFDFDMDLLEHVMTELPGAEGAEALVFDHQKAHARLGDQVMFKYDQVQTCYWNSDFDGLECVGKSGRSVRLRDPNMTGNPAKEVLFRLANICQWNPQNAAPVVKVEETVTTVAFDPAVEFPLPRETTMLAIIPQADWTKPDDMQIKHGDRNIVFRVHDNQNATFLDGVPWYSTDKIKEFVFRRQELAIDIVFEGGRLTMYVGDDRPAAILENRVKQWARSRKLAISEASPTQGRKILNLGVQLGRTVIEGGQLRIPGNRDVLFHHGQKAIRLDGEPFANYGDITQLRIKRDGDKLTMRIWIKPSTLVILDDSTPSDERSQTRIPEVIKVLCQAVGRPLEVA